MRKNKYNLIKLFRENAGNSEILYNFNGKLLYDNDINLNNIFLKI